MGPAAQAAIALQGIAAHCMTKRPVPESLWRQLHSAPSLGSDLHTINALAWMAGAFDSDTCAVDVRNKLQKLLAAVPPADASWNPATQRLRDLHLQRLLATPQ